MKRPFCILLAILMSTALTGKTLHAESFDYKQVYKLRSSAVVVVIGLDQSGDGSLGTGSVIQNGGLIITNAHVIIDDNTNRVYPRLRVCLRPKNFEGGRKRDLKDCYKVRVIKYSNGLDLALLKIKSPPSNLPVIPFADSRTVETGDPVLAIGHPEQGGFWTLTTGIISTKIKDFQGIKGKDVFQTETSFNRGNSGGPLLNLQGAMVGVNSNIARKSKDGIAITDINFSITSRVTKEWVEGVGFKLAYLSVPDKVHSKKEKVDLKLERYPIIPKKQEKKIEQNKVMKPKQTPEKRKKLWAQGTQLTPKRPYMPKNFIKIEDEMESQMEDMKKSFR
jgi:serine protease Do